MLYTINDLIQRVQALIGEAATHPIFYSEDDCTADRRVQIADAIVQAATEVHSSAPAWQLTDIRIPLTAETLYWRHTEGRLHRGHFLLPTDFMRLLTLRMSDWQRPVTAITSPGSAAYHLLHCAETAFAGNPQRPRCYIEQLPEGQALVFSSCGSTHVSIAEAYYIPYPSFSPEGSINLARHLLPTILAKTISRLAH